MHNPLSRFLAWAAGALLTAMATAAAAQDIFTYTQAIETGFAEIETERLAGHCEVRDRRLAELRRELQPVLAPGANGYTEQGKAEYRTRLEEAAARRCPPGAKPAAPPVAIPAPLIDPDPPRPLPRTVTMEDLRADLAEACGPAFEPARRRFLVSLDRAIASEKDPTQLRYLKIDRAAVVRLVAPVCPRTTSPPPIETQAQPPAPTPAQDAFGRHIAIRQYYIHANGFRTHTYAAGKAAYDGDCDLRNRELAAARASLAAMRATGYAPPGRRYDAEILAELEARRCTPKNATAAPARTPREIIPARQQPAVPPASDPPRTVAPAKPARTAARVPPCEQTYQDQVKSGRGMTCRCIGPERFLMVWGSDPYRANSAICSAAIHAGVLPASGIGVVHLIGVPMGEAALGSIRNGVSTYNWDFFFEGAFSVEPAPH